MKSDLDHLVDQMQGEIIEEARRQYSEVVVDHWLHPRNFRLLDDADGHAIVTGPCGDTMEMFVCVREGVIREASFRTDGCITSVASGSMAVELAKGRTREDALAISDEDILDALDGLPEEGEHCALLAAKALHEAVHDTLLDDVITHDR